MTNSCAYPNIGMAIVYLLMELHVLDDGRLAVH